ncbi:hypothetical protein BC830DRAFT_1158634, partial [Chytriomyces sp. MP71]
MSPSISTDLPVLTYFDLPNLGRGEVVRLFLADAGIAYKDVRIPLDATWATKKQEIIASGENPYGGLPILELDGKKYTQHIPILRFLSRKLGKYGGSTEDDVYLLDAVSDLYVDWRASWVTTLGGDKAAHLEKVPKYYHAIHDHLVKRGPGPFMLGAEASYVDFAIYQILHNDGNLQASDIASKFPRLHQLARAVEARPAAAAYLNVRRKYEPFKVSQTEPVLTYFDLPNIGRGEVLRLFLADAGISYKDVRIPLDATWAAKKQDIIASGANAYGALPILELDGKSYTQHIPILRLLAQRLGKYEATNDDDIYFLDAVADLYIDWKASWVTTLSGDKTAHLEKAPKYYHAIHAHLLKHGAGPYA